MVIDEVLQGCARTEENLEIFLSVEVIKNRLSFACETY